MKRMIMNADDFGLSHGVNLGIIRAHSHGIVTSATLMVSMPGAAEAFELAKQTPSLGVGLHITLTSGKPLAQGVESLTGPDGRFLRLPELSERAKPEHLEREIRAQIEAFCASGLKPTHLDGHHHAHLLVPGATEIVTALAQELDVPVRQIDCAFSPGFYGRANITVDWLLQALESLGTGTTDFMCHPGYMDLDLPHITSYAEERVLELATLTDERIKDAIRHYEIELISYRDLRR